MPCSRCQHENAPGAKFCGECGARLDAACPSCRTVNPPANKFCRECGTALGAAAPPAAPAGDPRFTSPDAYTPTHLARKILTACRRAAAPAGAVVVIESAGAAGTAMDLFMLMCFGGRERGETARIERVDADLPGREL